MILFEGIWYPKFEILCLTFEAILLPTKHIKSFLMEQSLFKWTLAIKWQTIIYIIDKKIILRLWKCGYILSLSENRAVFQTYP